MPLGVRNPPYPRNSYPSGWKFDISKVPSSFSEATSCPDASIWHAAMDHELMSLDEMGAFEETDLPVGDHVIGLKRVFECKTDVNGVTL